MSYVGLTPEALRALHSLPKHSPFPPATTVNSPPVGIDVDAWRRLRERHLVHKTDYGWKMTQLGRTISEADQLLTEKISGQLYGV